MGSEIQEGFPGLEVAELLRLLELLHKQYEPVDRLDVLCWEVGSNKMFSFKSSYEK